MIRLFKIIQHYKKKQINLNTPIMVIYRWDNLSLSLGQDPELDSKAKQ